jgi:predicted amidohydrolase YtcJ
LQLIHPDDYSRFSELGVVANFQALWALPDEWIMNLNLPVVGMERVQRMYPIASLSRAGATIVGGSDWNVSSLNPLEAIEVGLLRQDWTKNDRLPDDATDQIDTLNPDERVDLDTMLRAYTVNAAWAMHQDTITGSLMRGKRADLVVLSRDLFAVPPQKISTVFVERTYMNGNLVYESGAVTD